MSYFVLAPTRPDHPGPHPAIHDPLPPRFAGLLPPLPRRERTEVRVIPRKCRAGEPAEATGSRSRLCYICSRTHPTRSSRPASRYPRSTTPPRFAGLLPPLPRRERTEVRVNPPEAGQGSPPKQPGRGVGFVISVVVPTRPDHPPASPTHDPLPTIHYPPPNARSALPTAAPISSSSPPASPRGASSSSSTHAAISSR